MVFGMDPKIFTAIISAAFVLVVFTLMARSWFRRTRRQEADGALPPLPADLSEREPLAAVEGMYVATCLRGNHFDRVMGHGLGLRTSARTFVYHDGVLYDRDGAEPLWVPAESVQGHGTTSGMVGKFVERDGIVLLGWRLRDQEVDTGMRTKSRDGKAALIAAFDHLLAQRDGSADGQTATGSDSTNPGTTNPETTNTGTTNPGATHLEPTGHTKETP